MQINQIKNFLLGSVENNEKSVLESSEEVMTQSPPIPNNALIIVIMLWKNEPYNSWVLADMVITQRSWKIDSYLQPIIIDQKPG